METDEKLVPGEFLMPGIIYSQPGRQFESGHQQFQQIIKCRFAGQFENDIVYTNINEERSYV